MKFLKTFLLLILLICFSVKVNCQSAVKIDKIDSPESILTKASHLVPSQRQLEWQKMEFTFFIHFGMNTFTNREWGVKGTPASTFNPSALDAEQWARTAKEAGAKLILMVAKHHDGFCLWQSKYTEYCVKNSPWKDGKGDVIAEVSSACKKYGLKFGVYLSPWDINSPIYGTEEYNAYFKNQLRELLSNYGEIAEVWFDGACGEGPNGKRQVYDWAGYYKLIRELAPKAVIAVMGPDVRWVGTESGYGRETEWSVVPVSSAVLDQIASSSQQTESLTGSFKPPGDMMEEDLGSREKILKAEGLVWYPSEVDVSIRDGWFYHSDQDNTVKSPEKLVDIYYSSVGRNSLLLLNVPPDKRGLIHENDVASLRGMRKILEQTHRNLILADSNPIGSNNIYEYKFSGSRIFNRLELQEDITKGQRVERFVFEILKNGQWMEVTKGTTIGYKRLLRFEDVEASIVRLRILESRAETALSIIKLLKSPEDGPRTIVLNDNWKFCMDSLQSGMEEKWYVKSLPFLSCKTVNIPHTWKASASQGRNNVVSWYERTFVVPEEWKDKRLLIRFNGVYRDATVWINGIKAREHTGNGYTAFDVELFRKYKIGENRLLVRVDNNNTGGIFRDVILTVSDKLGFQTVLVKPIPCDTSTKKAKLSIDLMFTRKVRSSGKPVILSLTLTEENQSAHHLILKHREFLSAPDKVAYLKFELDSIHNWSPDQANLYKVEIQLTQDSVVLDNYTTNVGFHPSITNTKCEQTAFTRTEAVKDVIVNLEALRKSGINCVSFTWPQDAEVYDWCDSHGMYIQQDLPIQDIFEQAMNDDLQSWAYRQVCDMLEQHYNHTSIVAWRINKGNILNGKNEDYLKRLYNFIQTIDSTRQIINQ